MLITKTFHDVPTKLSPNGKPVRIFIISPNVPDYPQAKFPGAIYHLALMYPAPTSDHDGIRRRRFQVGSESGQRLIVAIMTERMAARSTKSLVPSNGSQDRSLAKDMS